MGVPSVVSGSYGISRAGRQTGRPCHVQVRFRRETPVPPSDARRPTRPNQGTSPPRSFWLMTELPDESGAARLFPPHDSPMKILNLLAPRLALVIAGIALPGIASGQLLQGPSTTRLPDVIYVPTPQPVVNAMLK